MMIAAILTPLEYCFNVILIMLWWNHNMLKMDSRSAVTPTVSTNLRNFQCQPSDCCLHIMQELLVFMLEIFPLSSRKNNSFMILSLERLLSFHKSTIEPKLANKALIPTDEAK
ncbi:hypothetical protein FCV25MIE_19891 [Fagus crenata]